MGPHPPDLMPHLQILSHWGFQHLDFGGTHQYTHVDHTKEFDYHFFKWMTGLRYNIINLKTFLKFKIDFY